ncbi:L-rhamnose 1-epimerase [Aeromicrobium sp. Root236]|nr:L-rhamnose 1-epimerase [Aeromicrobium sp. Root236]
MERHGSMVRLRADHEAEYVRLHAEVWPEVLQQIRASGIRNYTIFLRDGLLFSYYEYVGDDHARDMAAMAADPVTQDWWRLTDPCQQPVDTAEPGELWAPLRQVFHAD